MNEWILRIITMVITVMSPELRKALVDMVNNLDVQAKKTSNPLDDILVGLLKSILSI